MKHQVSKYWRLSITQRGTKQVGIRVPTKRIWQLRVVIHANRVRWGFDEAVWTFHGLCIAAVTWLVRH